LALGALEASNVAGRAGTLAKIALRFCLSKKAGSTVIPGMRRVETVESSCRASKAGALNVETVAVLKRHAQLRNFYQPDTATA
jgi:aryl-alcohol dehydrogenase-like predicted oxidoreductase